MLGEHRSPSATTHASQPKSRGDKDGLPKLWACKILYKINDRFTPLLAS